MNLKFSNPILPIGEIKIPEEFSMPRLEKLKKCMDFYRKNGRFDRQIIVDGDKTLRDGYCAYLTAYLLSAKTVKALMVMEQAEPIKAIPPAEPVELYCVKDYGSSIKRGDTGVFDPEVGGIVFGNIKLGYISGSDTFEQWKERNKSRAPHFWPLVQRPAKVGEWVYVKHAYDWQEHEFGVKPGKIYKVHKAPQSRNECDVRLEVNGEKSSVCVNVEENYLVLDGYKGEADES